ncbi:PREDICTED: PDZ domain-containing protein 8-like [Priapulus caudatus]|uniref:PDZ domain-containing protein 8-like n=1 Tax=Priapulus caudatus TaxID=37621 RepID=A0ABM1DYP4_PRICU|nr:PREDICTED: PDZ domain-containing protein 8-like [Priapulus caudatus]
MMQGKTLSSLAARQEIPPSDQELRGKHDFIGTQFHSSTACHFCGKRIWLKVAFQCRACAMICHKKCLLRCQSQTVCSSLRARNQTSAAPAACISTGGITQPPPVVIATHADDVSPVTSSAESTPLDTPMDSPVMRRRRVPSMGSLLAEVVPERITRSGSFCSLTPPDRRRNISKSLPPSPLCSPITKRKTFLPVPLVKREDSTEEEIQQAIHKLMAIQGNDPNSELLASAAKEMGKELHCNLPQEERKQKLNNRILQLQEEMKKETDHQEDVRRSRRGVTDPRAQEQLKEAARKSDDKVQALALMLLHYCSGLQACLAQEHPEDKDAAAMKDKDAAAVKDKDAAAMKDGDAASVKDKDAAAVKDKDAAAVKDEDASAVKDEDAGVGDENTVFHDVP